MRGKTDAEAALQEAWEEAGVKTATVTGDVIGSYGYDKVSNSGLPVPVETMVYPVKVETLAEQFPECHERKRQWMSPTKAATLVREPELQSLLRVL